MAAKRFVIQVTVSQQTHAKLVRLKELLSHALPGGELAEVLDYALSTTITHVEGGARAGKRRTRTAAGCDRGTGKPGLSRGAGAELAERSNAPGLTLEQHVRAALQVVYAARPGKRDPAAA
ncbi:MAG TPA: hypothetical protein VFK69_10030 [Candidatus Eisenbacteria bacterium]|nr:hypothetical protein [Candidatus Eisenbacteria bacterium]